VSALCSCEIYEHCSICDPDYFKTVSASKPRQATTPSQPNGELDKVPMNSDTPKTDAVETLSHEKHVHLRHEDCHTSYWCFSHADMVNHSRTLERENNQLRAAAGFCEKHQPDGGMRNCLVCGCEKLTHALDRISYACGEPNEHGLSEYGNHYDEEIVVKQVEQLRADLKQCAFPLDEIITHLAVLAKALRICRQHAINDDDRSYWDHEIKAHESNTALISKALSLPSVQNALKGEK
jgi:hypothetical protein